MIKTKSTVLFFYLIKHSLCMSGAPVEDLKNLVEAINEKMKEENLKAKTELIFEQYDINADKVLNKSELSRFMLDLLSSDAFETEPASEFIKQFFSSLDKDDSGTLDFNEVVLMGKTVLQAVKDEAQRCIDEQSKKE